MCSIPFDCNEVGDKRSYLEEQLCWTFWLPSEDKDKDSKSSDKVDKSSSSVSLVCEVFEAVEIRNKNQV